MEGSRHPGRRPARTVQAVAVVSGGAGGRGRGTAGRRRCDACGTCRAPGRGDRPVPGGGARRDRDGVRRQGVRWPPRAPTELRQGVRRTAGRCRPRRLAAHRQDAPAEAAAERLAGLLQGRAGGARAGIAAVRRPARLVRSRRRLAADATRPACRAAPPPARRSAPAPAAAQAHAPRADLRRPDRPRRRRPGWRSGHAGAGVPVARAVPDRTGRRVPGHGRAPVADLRPRVRRFRRRPCDRRRARPVPDRRSEAGHLRLPGRRCRHVPVRQAPSRHRPRRSADPQLPLATCRAARGAGAVHRRGGGGAGGLRASRHPLRGGRAGGCAARRPLPARWHARTGTDAAAAARRRWTPRRRRLAGSRRRRLRGRHPCRPLRGPRGSRPDQGSARAARRHRGAGAQPQGRHACAAGPGARRRAGGRCGQAEPVRDRRGRRAAHPAARPAASLRQRPAACGTVHGAVRPGRRRHRRPGRRRRCAARPPGEAAALARTLAAQRPVRTGVRTVRRTGHAAARPAGRRAAADELPATGRAPAGGRRPHAGPAGSARLAADAHRPCRSRRRSAAAAAGKRCAACADRHPAQEQGPGISAGLPAVRRAGHPPSRHQPSPHRARRRWPPRAAVEDRQGGCRMESGR